MTFINDEIGKKIRKLRKSKNITLEELSSLIHKSKSTISKYEKGEISIDIETLYDISSALDVSITELIYYPAGSIISSRKDLPNFFRDLQHFYSYYFDGRANKLIRCVFDIVSEPRNDGSYAIMMYMNFRDYDNYQKCENTYFGYIEHYDDVTNIQLSNRDMPMEKASIKIMASSLNHETKWGLFCGFSSRPMMPVAVKMFFSKERLEESKGLTTQLKVSKEDIRLLKLYNMLPVT